MRKRGQASLMKRNLIRMAAVGVLLRKNSSVAYLEMMKVNSHFNI